MTDILPFAFTIFCDDIRHEIDGKQSFIGAYSGAMFFQEPPPLVLPKFCFAITLMEPTRLAFVRDFPLRVSIEIPGSPSGTSAYTQEIPYQPELKRVVANPFAQDGDDNYIRSNVNVVSHNLTIPEPGSVRVRILYGAHVIKCGSLNVMSAPAQQDKSPPGAAFQER